MIFNIIYSAPRVFSQAFAYKVFPNLKIEYDYLVGIGKSAFAQDFVHYQINITMFSFCLFVILIAIYVLIMLIKWRKIEIAFLSPSFKKIPYTSFKVRIPFWWCAAFMLVFSAADMWGLLSSRVSAASGKLVIDTEYDYIMLWWMFLSGYFSAFSLPVIIVNHILIFFQKRQAQKRQAQKRQGE